ncbi:dolichyl-diphosphooligosaccharide-- glycosyltransferase subunit 1A [Chlorella sorokiniana]|uniref:Dolichyl-diphosphooligosaccharide--protein glycosyltransferase subunit 1 n=1 Tax=Chlorella sorokiniana TaxID=3076 RepID=A0A2P6TC53_CHLSO|nr:dolichyl-diphosphooligosaccharide-- glycosyltransferase subunit 1A [Chlorella sorokiniana]|eukprot:PRW20208.1 dolichyl-diphosphooligosaccharide-- glycosyltransferase subunit 1A [Chlorella sorokiniana]
MARLAAALLVLALASIGASAQLVIEDAQRQIDISGFVAHEQLQLGLRNDGPAAAASLLLCGPHLARAAYLEIKETSGKDASKLAWKEAAAPAGAPAGVTCREVTLSKPLAKKGTARLTAVAAYTHVLRPEPAEVRQRDAQHVLFESTAQLASPYKVAKQSTEIKVGGGVQSATDVSPYKSSGSKLSYGPYSDVEPWAAQQISVHYENNAPFAAAEVEREIEISHWGNVYVEERYHVRHVGAKLVGEWSRWDLTRDPKQFAQAGIPSFAAALPPQARSLYYRDAIGNISSSETRRSSEGVRVTLVPRYPLFGGWSSTFTFGYSLPLSSVVGKEPKTGRSVFAAPIGPALGDIVVDSLLVKVVLPEGASDPKVALGLPFQLEQSVAYTYLDVLGRPVAVLRLSNLVQEMKPETLQVSYTYSSMGLLQKPLLLVGVLGAIFAIAIVAGRGGLASLAASPSVRNVVAKPHAS